MTIVDGIPLFHSDPEAADLDSSSCSVPELPSRGKCIRRVSSAFPDSTTPKIPFKTGWPETAGEVVSEIIG